MAKTTEKKEILTAEEQAQKFMDTYPQGDNMLHMDDRVFIAKLLKQYAGWHVKAALKIASEKAEVWAEEGYDEGGHHVEKESILKAYPVENIK